jgi:hypothetical protein
MLVYKDLYIFSYTLLVMYFRREGTILFLYLKNGNEALELENGGRKSAPPGDESLQVDVTAGFLRPPSSVPNSHIQNAKHCKVSEHTELTCPWLCSFDKKWYVIFVGAWLYRCGYSVVLYFGGHCWSRNLSTMFSSVFRT